MTINSMQKIYLFAKQVHRLLVVLISGLGAVMALTGLMLKYPGLLGFGNLGLVRLVHSSMSTAFAAVLVLMILTGLVMYSVPWLQKRRARRAAAGQAQTIPPQT